MRNGSPIGILALQGNFQAHSSALARVNIPTKYVRTPADLTGIAGLILPGGESTTILKLAESEGLWEPMRRFARSHPVFGTCAGAILMASQVDPPPQHSLDLIPMTVRRNAYGRQLASSIRHAETARELNIDHGPGPPLEVVLIRAPIITAVGPQTQVLASIDGQPILVRKGPHLAATFHPELTDDTRVHGYFCRMVFSDRTPDHRTGK